jgi:hypothetical protein
MLNIQNQNWHALGRGFFEQQCAKDAKKQGE